MNKEQKIVYDKIVEMRKAQGNLIEQAKKVNLDIIAASFASAYEVLKVYEKYLREGKFNG